VRRITLGGCSILRSSIVICLLTAPRISSDGVLIAEGKIDPQGEQHRLHRPVGQITTKSVKSLRYKEFSLPELRIIVYAAHPSPPEGRSYVVANAGWGAVDAGGVGARAVKGRAG
jgi:hypothetical protein